jgi:hypothetical protein
MLAIRARPGLFDIIRPRAAFGALLPYLRVTSCARAEPARSLCRLLRRAMQLAQ